MKMVPKRCPETSVRNYHFSLRNNTEERSKLYQYRVQNFCFFKTISYCSNYVKSGVKTAVAVPCLAAAVTCVLLAVFQSLLRGALSQQSAVILICMAIDRYMCMLHPARYHKHASKKVRL